MSFYFYILYSKRLDKFYIGHTHDLEGRLRRHLSEHKGFTGSADDLEIVYKEEYITVEKAYSRERQVKLWKSRKLIEELTLKSHKVKDSEHPDLSGGAMVPPTINVRVSIPPGDRATSPFFYYCSVIQTSDRCCQGK